MSDIGRDKLLDCLFNGQDRKLINVKFYRGCDDVISEEQFENDFCASVKRHKESFMATKGNMPKSKKKAVDLEKLVADM
jgi:hypothetical protein